jgi:hypothetical protein
MNQQWTMETNIPLRQKLNVSCYVGWLTPLFGKLDKDKSPKVLLIIATTNEETWVKLEQTYKEWSLAWLTVSLPMSYIYGALSKARNLTSYIYIYIYIWTRYFTGDFVSRTVHFVIYAWKPQKYTNYLFSLLIMYGSSYMLRHCIAIIRERS